jgi:16S rRNA (guanine527-N7)-methyltransferase
MITVPALSPTQRATLERYLDQLMHWNRVHRLVGLRERHAIWERLFLESAALVPVLRPLKVRRLVDVGSGAGFPGLVLKVLLPEVHVLLVEAGAKRASFLHYMAADLALPHLEVVAQQAEQVRPESLRSPGRFDVLTARAFGPVPRLLAAAGHLLAPNGRLLLPRGEDVAQYPEGPVQVAGRSFRSRHLKLPGRGGTLLILSAQLS